ncbi:LuxR C-terminal-related transcriptional regulator, partial [Streptomyces sp. NPDC096080]|uniref:LuxR C-terminal-related transcriptional regulator n=1 Tax=Streptomyces sp. NPDC096080 TaxID=3156693 RepID=UPI003322429F
LERSPAAYELAWALVALGAELRRTGRPGAAAEALHRGLDTAAQCGADALAGTARAELAAAGLRPRRLRTAQSDALTGRERAAARLLAAGRTEPEVARELRTDEPTVVRLLSAVYRKLGTDPTGLTLVPLP